MGSTCDDDPAGCCAAAAVLGWSSAGVLNLAASALLREGVTATFEVRALAAAVELGRHVALGVVCAGLVWVWARLSADSGAHVRLARLTALALVCLVVGPSIMYEDAAGFAGRTSESTGLPQDALHITFVVAASQVVTLAWLATRWLASKPFGWLLGLGGAVVVYWFNADLWQQDNPGLHFWMSCTIATMLGAVAIERIDRLPERITTRPPWLDWVVIAVLVSWGGLAMLWPASNKIKVHLAGWSPNLLTLAKGVGDLRSSNLDELSAEYELVFEDPSNFFEDRDEAPPVPPTQPALIEGQPIVIMLTVDGVRFDLLESSDSAAFVPVLSSLHDQGAWFEAARAPGSQTVYSLSTLSTSRYFSQMYWKKRGKERWLHEDESTHFAEKLSEAGVTTVIAPGAQWFENDYGVLRGFAEGEYQKSEDRWTHAKTLTTRINEALVEHHAKGPLFIFCHYLDPHKPYDSGKITEGPHFRRYLSELEMVDEQIGLVVDKITELGLWDRTVLIVSSDHGEAFKEHGVKAGHAVNLYDELLRVPLVVRGPNVVPRHVSEPVSLVDFGPTVLDLFGVETPGVFMGQSLVPLLRGDDVELTRPIVAEGRLERAMVFRNGLKVIIDYELDTVEIYDLNNDPKELDNLADSIDLAANDEYLTLRKFFEVHTFDDIEGYEVPMRK